MFKLNIFLVLVLIACALGIVTSQHTARKLFMALENEKEIERKLDVEWGRLPEGHLSDWEIDAVPSWALSGG